MTAPPESRRKPAAAPPKNAINTTPLKSAIKAAPHEGAVKAAPTQSAIKVAWPAPPEGAI